MDFTGQKHITAPRPVVWACLNDPDLLKTCIPGCVGLDWISDHELTAAIRINVGPLKATFKGLVTLSNVVPGESYTIAAHGKGGMAGFAGGSADIGLSEAGGDTTLHYVARAELGGMLAKLAGKLIDSTSQVFAARFFADLNAAITQRALGLQSDTR